MKEEKIDDLLQKKSPELLKAKKKAKNRVYDVMNKYIGAGPTYTGMISFPESTQITEADIPRATVALMNMLSFVRKTDKEFEANLNSLKAMWRDGLFEMDEYENMADAYKHIIKGLTIFEDEIEGKIKTLRGK